MSDLSDLLDALNSIEVGIVEALAHTDTGDEFGFVMQGLKRAADGACVLRLGLTSGGWEPST